MTHLEAPPFKPYITSKLMPIHKQNSRPFRKAKRRNLSTQHTAGFGLTEVVLSVAAGSLLITGGVVAMRSLSSSMQASGQISGLRGSAMSGLRQLRSETQRSLHLMVPGGTAQEGQSFTDLNHPDYSDALSECQSLSQQAQGVFNPMFGMRMAELDTPVVYGLGMSSNGKNYALLRCGPVLSGDGRYETESVILSPIMENIGVTPCDADNCATSQSLREVVAGLDNNLQASNQSPLRSFPEPALAIETDSMRKLLKLKDPTAAGDPIEFSFLQPPGSRRDLRVDLNFTAYARADKINRIENNVDLSDTGLSGCSAEGDCSFYGIPVTSDKVQLVVDGSGSMSTCIAWGSTYGNKRRIFYNGRRYYRTRKTCLLTRMESLQNELRALLESLSETTTISLQSFSSPGYLNHRSWNGGAMTPLTPANRSSALNFVNSLSAGKPNRWGGTRPWNSLDRAFLNTDSNTLFFMTDGDPNNDRNGGNWGSSDYQPTADTYISMNNQRDSKLSVNTVSVGQPSQWLELTSGGANGIYKIIDDN